MTAVWTIKKTGEVLKILVTKNPDLFEKLIASDDRMQFIGWEQ
jgi:hypothetical protein